MYDLKYLLVFIPRFDRRKIDMRTNIASMVFRGLYGGSMRDVSFRARRTDYHQESTP